MQRTAYLAWGLPNRQRLPSLFLNELLLGLKRNKHHQQQHDNANDNRARKRIRNSWVTGQETVNFDKASLQLRITYKDLKLNLMPGACN